MPQAFADVSHGDKLNMLNPMADHFAQQSLLFASNNPMNPDAQRTAQYWAQISQRRAHYLQMMASQQPAGMAPCAASSAGRDGYAQRPASAGTADLCCPEPVVESMAGTSHSTW